MAFMIECNFKGKNCHRKCFSYPWIIFQASYISPHHFFGHFLLSSWHVPGLRTSCRRWRQLAPVALDSDWPRPLRAQRHRVPPPPELNHDTSLSFLRRAAAEPLSSRFVLPRSSCFRRGWTQSERTSFNSLRKLQRNAKMGDVKDYSEDVENFEGHNGDVTMVDASTNGQESQEDR